MERHPDRGGSPEDFLRLAEARAALLESPATALMPVAEVRDLVQAVTGVVAERERRLEMRDQTRAIVRHAIRIRTTSLRQLQRRMELLALVSAILGGVSQVARLLPWHPKWPNFVSAGFGVIVIVLGVAAAFLAQRKSEVEGDIEEAAEAFNDKGAVVAALRAILNGALSGSWTAPQWHDAVDEWVRERHGHLSRDSIDRYAARMGSYEFSRLVLAKAKEYEVVRESERWVDDGLIVVYELNRPPAPKRPATHD
jgi:hypothetical protein